jgi:FkbH-like protein
LAEEIRRLDSLGLLHSLASRNHADFVLPRLAEAGIGEYFLHPQIRFDNTPKSAWIEQIARDFNLGLDAVAFIDDQAFEREQVRAALPLVTVVDIVDVMEFLHGPRMPQGPATAESRSRRGSYQAAAAWTQAERQHAEAGGDLASFLATTDLRFTIEPAGEHDLERMEDLTVRTHQLNSTGTIYSITELDALRTSPDHVVLIASLRDRFDSYGRIGLAVIEKRQAAWHLHLLLMSCRVLTRGVGQVMMHHILTRARAAGARELLADYVEISLGNTIRNRQMYLAYKLAGFRVVDRGDADNDGQARVLFRHDLTDIAPIPEWVTVEARS